MDEGDGLLVVLLVVVLVLDEAHVDEVAHGGAGVPADIVGVDVDLLEVTDHLVLVDNVGLGAGSGGGEGGGIGAVIAAGDVDGGELEGVGDLDDTVVVHANDGTGGDGREAGRAVLHDLHDHLWLPTLVNKGGHMGRRAGWGRAGMRHGGAPPATGERTTT